MTILSWIDGCPHGRAVCILGHMTRDVDRAVCKHGRGNIHGAKECVMKGGLPDGVAREQDFMWDLKERPSYTQPVPNINYLTAQHQT